MCGGVHQVVNRLIHRVFGDRPVVGTLTRQLCVAQVVALDPVGFSPRGARNALMAGLFGRHGCGQVVITNSAQLVTGLTAGAVTFGAGGDLGVSGYCTLTIKKLTSSR